VHYDLHHKSETTSNVKSLASPEPIVIGITAGASCPNNLIEETVLRVFELRGISRSVVQGQGG